jgi:hypothetical protein
MSGYLYILYNEAFKQYSEKYGDDVYKLGMTIDLKKRMKGYTTSFIDDCKILYSIHTPDCFKAERILFYLLRSERINTKREFFSVSLERCKKIFDKISECEQKELNAIYNQICIRMVPKEVSTQLDPLKVEEIVTKWTPTEYTDNLPYDEFFERFRFRPKHPEMWYGKGYVDSEQREFLKITSAVKNDEEISLDKLSI